MKKILFFSLFICFQSFGQTPKIEVVVGSTENSDGIKSILKNTSSTNYGIYGDHSGIGNGVYGRSSGGTGVHGFSQFGTGTSGVYGLAYGFTSSGVKGYSENGYGYGVLGSAESGIGVYGYAQNSFTSNGIGGYFSNASASGYALITGSGRVGIGSSAPSAQLDVARGNGIDGTAIFRGTTYTSHFNYSTNEDTYIRGGKSGSNVLINDDFTGGKVG
ncbi:MAG: hypothetical protein ACRCVT_14725, partial [Leadbetterella sp.]